MTSSVEVCTLPLLYDQVTWRGVKVLRELEVRNRQEYEALKIELIEHHDAPPNSLLVLRSPYEVEAFYISTQPTMYRTAIYLHDFHRDSNHKVWRRLLRPYTENDLALYDLYMENPRGRQQPLRDKAFEVFRKRINEIYVALPAHHRGKYWALTQYFRRRWAEQDWEQVRQVVQREIQETLRPPYEYLDSLQVLLSIASYVGTWNAVGRRANRVATIEWPQPIRYISRELRELQAVLSAPMILPLWGLDDNNWLPLLGVPDG